MKVAAIADVYGGNGDRILSTTDPVESLVLQAKAVAAAELAIERDKRLARFIVAAMNGKLRG